MKRRTVTTDRLACAVAGSALLALGLGGAAWAHGDLPASTDGPLSAGWLNTAPSTTWWPFALAGVGVLLIIAGVAWLIAHRPGQSPGSLQLPGSSSAGRLTVDLDTAAQAAAASLAAHPAVESATGRCRTDRGQRVVELDVKFDARTDLGALSTAVVGTREELTTALDGVAFTSRILLRTPRRAKETSRVA